MGLVEELTKTDKLRSPSPIGTWRLGAPDHLGNRARDRIPGDYRRWKPRLAALSKRRWMAPHGVPPDGLSA